MRSQSGLKRRCKFGHSPLAAQTSSTRSLAERRPSPRPARVRRVHRLLGLSALLRMLRAVAASSRSLARGIGWVAVFVAPPVLRAALAIPFLKSGLTKWHGFLSLSPVVPYMFANMFKLHLLGHAASRGCLRSRASTAGRCRARSSNGRVRWSPISNRGVLTDSSSGGGFMRSARAKAPHTPPEQDLRSLATETAHNEQGVLKEPARGQMGPGVAVEFAIKGPERG